MENKKLIAFHGDKKIKEKYIQRVQFHRLADEIHQGYGYWEDGKGCAVGCTLHGSDHMAYERELGIPVQLAHLEDAIFERLPAWEAQVWPELFLKAVPVGANLSTIWPQWAIWMLTDPEYGIARFATGDGVDAVATVAKLFRREVMGDHLPPDEWAEAKEQAKVQAKAAEGRTAEWAAMLAAVWAAEAAAVVNAAAEAVWAAEATWAAARKAWTCTAADELIKLLGGSAVRVHK